PIARRSYLLTPLRRGGSPRKATPLIIRRCCRVSSGSNSLAISTPKRAIHGPPLQRVLLKIGYVVKPPNAWSDRSCCVTRHHPCQLTLVVHTLTTRQHSKRLVVFSSTWAM